MGKRKKYPHEEIVQEIRELVVSTRYTTTYSDDMDQYYTEAAGYSPINEQAQDVVSKTGRAEELGKRLAEIGEPAADAVALGLRMQGAWREKLLPFASKFAGLEVIKTALLMIIKRERDPLKETADGILDELENSTKKPLFRWKQGYVNTEGEHFRLYYEDIKTPVATLGRRSRSVFIVNFEHPWKNRKRFNEALRQVKKELDFFLVEKDEQNPWAYARYHACTGANVYSSVHWGYFRGDE